MKKLILIIMFMVLSFPTISLAETSICYYLPQPEAGGWTLPEENCNYFQSVIESLNIPMVKEPFSNFSVEKASSYEVVYISGYGDPKGFIYDSRGGRDSYKYFPWSELAKIDTQLVLIDACYSGMIYDYPYKAQTLITSAYKTPSWNIMDGNNNISSFVSMLRCLFEKGYSCPINIPECGLYGSSIFVKADPQACQFHIVIDSLKEKERIIIQDWEDYAISVVYINGKPWRN